MNLQGHGTMYMICNTYLNYSTVHAYMFVGTRFSNIYS